MNIENHSDHYSDQSPKEIEALSARLVKAGFNPERIPWVIMAFKYFFRLGAKDDVEKELNKIENYIHRSLTGDWRQSQVTHEKRMEPIAPTKCSTCYHHKRCDTELETEGIGCQYYIENRRVRGAELK